MSSLKYMKYFYEMYPNAVNQQRDVDTSMHISNRQQLVDDLGILICKDMDKVEAQYALESSSQPLGVSSYELSK